MILRLTKVHFTLFGLPITIAGALLAATLPPLSTWLYIVLAFIAARTAGMAFNQVIDRHIDARNPRTQDRPIPTSQITPFRTYLIAWSSLALYLIACFQINTLVFALSPLPAILIFLYSYTKRFTSLCHFVLGAIQACGPIYAYAAVAGTLAWPPIFLGLALWTSITANDITYAFADLDFDRVSGVHSIPARLGQTKALWLSRALHLSTVMLLIPVSPLAALLVLPILRLPSFFLSNTLFSAITFGAILWQTTF